MKAIKNQVNFRIFAFTKKLLKWKVSERRTFTWHFSGTAHWKRKIEHSIAKEEILKKKELKKETISRKMRTLQGFQLKPKSTLQRGDPPHRWNRARTWKRAESKQKIPLLVVCCTISARIYTYIYTYIYVYIQWLRTCSLSETDRRGVALHGRSAHTTALIRDCLLYRLPLTNHCFSFL